MRIDWAIPCRYAEINGGLATIVGAGIDTFYVPSVPAEIGVLVLIRLVCPDEETGPDHPHEVVARMTDPDLEPVAMADPNGEKLSELKATFHTGSNPLKQPGWESGTFMPTLQRFTAEKPGPYTLELAVDGRGVTVPLIVVVGPMPT